MKLLSNVLPGLGGGISLPSLNAAFKRSKKVQFEFVNVESTSVTPFALGKFLASGSLDTSNPFVTHYFGNDETQEYIIFDVLKSDTITVTSKSESGAAVDADIGALSGALSANVKANAGVSRQQRDDLQERGEGHLRVQALRGVLRERQVGAQGVRRPTTTSASRRQ